MNIAIIKQGTGRYLFEVPKGIVLKQGETVKCDTVRGITDGTVWADSLNVEEPAAKLIGSLFGAKFPLKQVVGKTEYKPFEDTKAAKPEEPKPEPTKLYCIREDYFTEKWLTKGKVYEARPASGVICDDGNCHVIYDARKMFLVPLVARPAKVGEWVYVLNKSDSTYEPCNIYKVFDTGFPSCVWFDDDCKGNIKEKDYLVLDGYKPEATQEPEPIPKKSMRALVDECCVIGTCTASVSNGRRKANCPLKIAAGGCGIFAEEHPEMRKTLEAYLENERKPEEPKYYTGKVVCVDGGSFPEWWTAGKVYKVTNGAMKRSDGSPYNGKATCPEELKPNNGAVFIEFVEA